MNSKTWLSVQEPVDRLGVLAHGIVLEEVREGARVEHEALRRRVTKTDVSAGLNRGDGSGRTLKSS